MTKATEERRARRGTRALWGRRGSRAPALALVSPLRVEDRRETKEQRVVLASDTRAIKENVGLRDLPVPPVLPDQQPRWFDLETAPLCSRCLDPLGRRDHQGQKGPQDLQELMESLVIQERMEKLVRLGLEVCQELQDLLVQKAKRVIPERVNQDPEAPLVYQDLLDRAPVTAQRSLTWRAQGTQTWIKSGVSVVLRAPQAHPAPLVLQWHWAPTVQ